MNNSLKFLMIAFVAVISIASCKKDKTEVPVTESGCKLSKIEINYNDAPAYTNNEIKITYDNLGRIKSYDNESDLANFSYSTNKVVISSLTDTYDMTLSDGRVTKEEYTGPLYNNTNYTYNSDGYLGMAQKYDGTYFIYKREFTYTNNNLTKIVETNRTGAIITTTNEFSTEVVSNNSMFIDFLWDLRFYAWNPTYNELPASYYGKLSTNLLVKSTTVFSLDKDILTTVENYTYERDASGKYISKTISGTFREYRNGVDLGVNPYKRKQTFTYDCK